MPTIVLATWIPAPVADCFTRSLDVDAHLATMEHTGERAVGGTTMIDTVRYDAPLGPLGRIAERVVLTRYLTGLLERRNAWLREDLTAPPDRDPA